MNASLGCSVTVEGEGKLSNLFMDLRIQKMTRNGYGYFALYLDLEVVKLCKKVAIENLGR